MSKNFADDIKLEEKKLYEEYKSKLATLKKIKHEKKAVGQIFTKGLLPIYVMYILSLGATNGNDIANKIGKRTNNLWIPSTGGIYPLLKKMEKQHLIKGSWNDPDKRIQKVYSLTNDGIHEFENKKKLLKEKMEDSLEVFKIVYKDLYEK